MAVVTIHLVIGGERFTRQCFGRQDPRKRRASVIGSVTVRAAGGSAISIAAVGAHPCGTDSVHAVRTAIVGGGQAAAMANGAFRNAPAIALKVNAVDLVVRLASWILGMLRSMAPRAFR